MSANNDEKSKQADGSLNMPEALLAAKLNRDFRKRVRIAAENPRGQFSSTWIFWANGSDYYFGAKVLTGTFKVSLHANGVGYVAYHKPYFLERKAAGIDLPAKTTHEWKLPIPSVEGARHLASLFLPADYCFSAPLSQKSRSKTLVFGLEDGCAAEIGLFLSRASMESLEEKFLNIGTPIFGTKLDNRLLVSLIARSVTFDAAKALPTAEQARFAKSTLLQKRDEIEVNDTLNAMFWTTPADGGAIQIIDIGGVKLRRDMNCQQ